MERGPIHQRSGNQTWQHPVEHTRCKEEVRIWTQITKNCRGNAILHCRLSSLILVLRTRRAHLAEPQNISEILFRSRSLVETMRSALRENHELRQ